jgi:peptidoglycan/LPS O-acetylase OafA/YrhL
MKTFLVISQTIFAFCLIPWLMVWGMSFMVFDAGVHFWNSFFFITISVFPIAVVGCSILAWLLRMRRRRIAIIVNLIPILWIGGLGLFLLISN